MIVIRLVLSVGLVTALRRPDGPKRLEKTDGPWSRPQSWSRRQKQKALSLAVLTLQNSALTLTMRYSRTRKRIEPRYLASEAVVMSEMVKLILSLVFAAASAPEERRNFFQRFFRAARDAYAEKGSYVLVVPAALYAVQNNLQYVAASNLEPAVFQLLYQMKLLFTALFSVLLLKRRLKETQWAAIALLAVGLGLASVGAKSSTTTTTARTGIFFAAGFAAVFAACCSSGFSSVYFEKVVKTRRHQSKPVSVWIRNAQLATFSTSIAALGALLKDGAHIRKRGLLGGFDNLVWTVVTLQAGGGLCTFFFCSLSFFLMFSCSRSFLPQVPPPLSPTRITSSRASPPESLCFSVASHPTSGSISSLLCPSSSGPPPSLPPSFSIPLNSSL